MTKAKKSEDGDGRRTKYLHEKVTATDQLQRRKELQRIYERASDLAMQLGFAFWCGKSNLRQWEMMRYNQHAACMPGTLKNKRKKEAGPPGTATDQLQRRKELQRIYERASDLAMQLGFAFWCGKSNFRQWEMMRYNQHAACMPGTEKNKRKKEAGPPGTEKNKRKKEAGLFGGSDSSLPLQGKAQEEMEASPSEGECDSKFPLQDDEEIGNDYPSWQDRCKEMEAAKQEVMEELMLRSLSFCALDWGAEYCLQ